MENPEGQQTEQPKPELMEVQSVGLKEIFDKLYFARYQDHIMERNRHSETGRESKFNTYITSDGHLMVGDIAGHNFIVSTNKTLAEYVFATIMPEGERVGDQQTIPHTWQIADLISRKRAYELLGRIDEEGNITYRLMKLARDLTEADKKAINDTYVASATATVTYATDRLTQAGIANIEFTIPAGTTSLTPELSGLLSNFGPATIIKPSPMENRK